MSSSRNPDANLVRKRHLEDVPAKVLAHHDNVAVTRINDIIRSSMRKMREDAEEMQLSADVI